MKKYIRPETRWVMMATENELLDISGKITDDPATEPAMSKDHDDFETDYELTPRNVWDE